MKLNNPKKMIKNINNLKNRQTLLKKNNQIQRKRKDKH